MFLISVFTKLYSLIEFVTKNSCLCSSSDFSLSKEILPILADHCSVIFVSPTKSVMLLFFFLSRLNTQHRAWTQDPEIKSHVLYQFSQPGPPVLIYGWPFAFRDLLTSHHRKWRSNSPLASQIYVYSSHYPLLPIWLVYNFGNIYKQCLCYCACNNNS